jgi:hypothetical protein
MVGNVECFRFDDALLRAMRARYGDDELSVDYRVFALLAR